MDTHDGVCRGRRRDRGFPLRVPPAASASFFAAAAFAVRKFSLSMPVSSLAFPLYLAWLWTWGLVSGGGNYLRFVLFAPFGLVATAVVAFLAGACARKAGLR